MFHIFLFLHIIAVLLSFAFTAGFNILCTRVARGGDAKVIHDVFSAAKPMTVAGGIGWIVTALLGIGLAQTGAIPLSQPWLIYSYAAFAVLIINGFGVHLPHQNKVIAASANGATPELTALLKSPTGPLAAAVSAISLLVIIYLMTARLG